MMAVELQELSSIDQARTDTMRREQPGILGQGEFSGVLAALMMVLQSNLQEVLPGAEKKAASAPVLQGTSTLAVQEEAAPVERTGILPGGQKEEENLLPVQGLVLEAQNAARPLNDRPVFNKSIDGPARENGTRDCEEAVLLTQTPVMAGDPRTSQVAGGNKGLSGKASPLPQEKVVSPQASVGEEVVAVPLKAEACPEGAEISAMTDAPKIDREASQIDLPGARLPGAEQEVPAASRLEPNNLNQAQDMLEPETIINTPPPGEKTAGRSNVQGNTALETGFRETVQPEESKEKVTGQQTGKAEFFQPQAQQTAGNRPAVKEAPPVRMPASELPEEFPRIVRARLEHGAGREGSREFIIQLEPKELGRLLVRLTSHDGVVSVKIAVEHAETKTLLENGMQSLRQSFSEQGIRYGRLDVELGGQFMNPQQHQQQQGWFREKTDYQGSWQGQQAYQDMETVVFQAPGTVPRAGIDYLV
ncbi:MAG: flagellar hook-length control protein FliK [Peptococcaceae bacterium]|jgi:flagellar hook-length control protein FliK|nr:flagellar hook-length control protein FliK [Peptococcaceae bacterium]MDH7524038.1 flagellar hook-length control protein FliK [Peptococcaceae bacterium]